MTERKRKMKTKGYRIIPGLAFFLALIALLLFCVTIYLDQQKMNEQLRDMDEKWAYLHAMSQASKMKALMESFNLTAGRNSTLDSKPDAMYFDSIELHRLTNLLKYLKPYKYVRGDSLAHNKLSPERGLILLDFLGSNPDTASLTQFFKLASFAYADLSGADLTGYYLVGANLRRADFREGQLGGANFRNALLDSAFLWGANLEKASFRNADLRRSDIRWVQGNGVDLKDARLDGADLSSGQFRHAEMHGASCQWAAVHEAFFNNANMTRMNCTGSKFARSNLRGATLNHAVFTRADLSEANLIETDLRHADLRFANLKGADLSGAILDSCIVDGDWINKLSTWDVGGLHELVERYEVRANENNQDEWILIKKE